MVILQSVYDGMIAHARAVAPVECCGILAGGAARICCRFPLENELVSPARYQGAPAGHFAALRNMRQRRLEMLGTYHSHPTSPAEPSQTDVEQCWYEDQVHFIVSLLDHDVPEVRAFRIQSRQSIQDVPFQIRPS